MREPIRRIPNRDASVDTSDQVRPAGPTLMEEGQIAARAGLSHDAMRRFIKAWQIRPYREATAKNVGVTRRFYTEQQVREMMPELRRWVRQETEGSL